MNFRRPSLQKQPTFSIPIPIPIIPLPQQTNPIIPQNPNLSVISSLLSKPKQQLQESLSATKITPTPTLLLQIFNLFTSSPKPLFTLFNWAHNHPSYQFHLPVFNAMVNSLAKARDFDSAWSLIRDRIGNTDVNMRPDFDTFSVMIRRYARAGLHLEAIRTYEYASRLDFYKDFDSGNNLFEILLDSLCKEGYARTASDYFDKQRAKDPSWLPTIRTYNILLNGWFRKRKLKNAERLWVQMKNDNIKPTVVTYGTIIEGLCRLRYPDVAMDLLEEMRREGVEPNAIVYNPIVDALGEAGRFKEALGMLERFSILESGPTISTYNSLVKGYCKWGDVVGACKILNMMMEKKCLPTVTTYGYFFRYFTKVGNSEVGLNLYQKLIRAGYEPDRLTYHQLVKMLCKEEKLEVTVQIIKEMREKGFDLDLATSTMLIHLLFKMQRYNEAFSEFEDMFSRGIVPLQLTYQRMTDEFDRLGMSEMAEKLHELMGSVPHSTKLPDTYRRFGNSSRERKMSIIEKAKNMSDILKTHKNPREIVK